MNSFWNSSLVYSFYRENL